jgi:predicted small metal-binding protein
MIRRISAVLFVLVLAVVFSTISFAQDSSKAAAPAKEEPMKAAPMKAAPMKEGKSEMMKSDKAMAGATYTGSCDPACGFMVKSHDKKEAADIIVRHAMKMHKKKVTEKEAMDMIKEEAAPPKE